MDEVREQTRLRVAAFRARHGQNGKPAKRRAGVVTGGPPRERLYAEAVGAGEEPDGRLTAPVPGEAARKGTGPCGQSLA